MTYPSISKTPNLAFEFALLALLSLLWGSSYGLIKLAVETITPVTLVAVRVSIAAGVLWLVVIARRRKIPTGFPIWRQLTIQALFGFIVPFTMITWGQQYVESGLAGILNSTTPIFVFLITLFWTRHERVNLENSLGVLAGLGGVSLLIGMEALAGIGTHIAGQLAITGATISYAIAMIYGKRFKGIAPEATAACTLTLAAIILLPASFAVERPLDLAPSWTSIWALIALAVFSTAGAFTLYFRLVNTLGSVGTSSVSYARAGISVMIGVLLLGETFNWQIAAGLGAVMIGVAAINGQFFSLFARTRRA
ncbi:MAG TPA: EamA/RhaT family transporter [Rhizobiales bacterium]|nr:EamA/RhaT family transporter [Hyphomicrobiales bacterium]